MSLLQGTLDILILTAVSEQALHGYAIAQEIGRRTAGEIEVEDAALYKALHRLQGRSLIDAEWGMSESRRRAKFYRITPQGAEVLASETSAWHRYVDAVAKVIDPRKQLP